MLTPNKIFKGRNSDGSRFTMEEWNFADIATLDAIGFVFWTAIGCLASAFIPLILTIMAIYYYNGRAKVWYIMTILVSAYFIYDANHGWMVTMILTWFFEESSINTLIAITTTCLVLNVIFLCVGGMLYDMIEKVTGEVRTRWIAFIGVVVLISLLSYNISKSHYSHTKGWVQRNINEGLTTKIKVE
jgi:hypothetical protein